MAEYIIHKTRHKERGSWAKLEMKHKENVACRIYWETQEGLIIKTEIKAVTQ